MENGASLFNPLKTDVPFVGHSKAVDLWHFLFICLLYLRNAYVIIPLSIFLWWLCSVIVAFPGFRIVYASLLHKKQCRTLLTAVH